MSFNWTDGLNPEQSNAVAHNYGPLLILAGAGSGKTTVLVARTGRLLAEQIIRPRELCVLTFTNKAAKELKIRVSNKLGTFGRGIWAGTFHSFGLHWLRKYYKTAKLTEGFGILDPSDASALVKELLRDFNYAGKVAYDSDRILSMISSWRETHRTLAASDEPYDAAVEWLLPRYLKKLELLGMVDFDCLILRPIELMLGQEAIRDEMQTCFQQVMVDEFQDTNQMQMKFLRVLTAQHHNLSVVGDDDQSIYGWRGACVSNILDFPKLYSNCNVIRLERNYRSTPSILNLANAVIGKNTKRHGKVLRSANASVPGDLPEIFVHDSEHEEAEGVTSEISDLLKKGYLPKQIAVLYRANSQGALVEAELRRLQIPYLTTGGTGFFDRKETRDILAYLRCSLKPNEVALRRIINMPPRGIGEKTLEAIGEFTKTHEISFLEATKRWRECGVDERIGQSIEKFFDLIRSFADEILNASQGTPGEKMQSLFDQMGYRTHIESYSGNALVATKRWKWVETFSRILDSYLERGGRKTATLISFLDAMELRDAMNDKAEKEDRVQLMTLHACKGLEFPVVFLMGIEEDLLPHKTLGTNMDEERRLFYVGITRAQKRLILTRAEKRRKHGKWANSVPSRFLLEIPSGLIKEYKGARPISENDRKSMIADLFKKIDSLSQTKKEPIAPLPPSPDLIPAPNVTELSSSGPEVDLENT